MSASDDRPSLLMLRRVTLDRDGNRLLSEIDLDVRAGERLLVLGPNGAGKTLLMQVAHRLIVPTGGQVQAAGPVREAMVFQRPVLLRRSVIGNVLYAIDHARCGCGLRGREGRDGRQERARAALALVGLAALAHRQARVLSGGEQQRVALARAAALRPDLVWLDEPTANLDPASTQAIESIVMQMSAEGATCVMTTHDIGQARRLGQRVVLMAGGRVIESTAAARFFEEPATDAGRRYLRGNCSMADNPADYLTVPEAAVYLRISPRKIYDLVSRSGLPHRRAGARLLFERTALAGWVRGNGADNGMPAPPLVLAGSHDALLDWAVRASHAALATLCRGSRDGLERVERREACAALLHLPEPASGRAASGGFNLEAVRKVLEGHDVVLLNWCWRQQGLMVARDNPFGIRSLDDLFAGTAGASPRVGRRCVGAGSRELFDQLLAERAAALDHRPGLDLAADDLESENDAALAVRLGQVDAVFGAQSAAQSIGLGFVPVLRERVDLLVNRRSYFEPPLQRLLGFCRTEPFAAHARALGGYDLEQHGTVIWNGA